MGEAKNDLVLWVLLVQESGGGIEVWSSDDGGQVVTAGVGVVVVEILLVRVLDELLVREKVTHVGLSSDVSLVSTPGEKVVNVGGGQVQVLVVLQDSVSGDV